MCPPIVVVGLLYSACPSDIALIVLDKISNSFPGLVIIFNYSITKLGRNVVSSPWNKTSTPFPINFSSAAKNLVKSLAKVVYQSLC